MADQSSFWKGVGRALGPDTVGWPVDTAQDVVNLLLTGGGTAAHKLGLIGAEQLPSPLKGSPGTSDWWAKHTNVPDDNSPEYTAGRLTPLAAVLAPQAAKAVPALIDALAAAPQGKAGQRGAIRVGGREDLMPSHQTTLSTMLLPRGQLAENPLPQELYSPSFGITKESLMSAFGGGDSFGSLWAIPKVGAFDPAYANTTLFNRDAYTPRWKQYEGRRADDWEQTKFLMGRDPNRYPEPEVAARAMGAKRLGDRLNIKAHEDVRKREGSDFGGPDDFSHNLAIDNSPAFRNFAQFERDPRGAATLDRNAAGQNMFGFLELHGIDDPLSAEGLMRTRDFTSADNLRDYLTSKSVGASQGRKAAIERSLAALTDQERRAGKVPSEYAELKAHGPVPLNSNQFAGLIIQPDRQLYHEFERYRQGGKGGISDDVVALDRLLKQADRRGLAGEVVHPDEADNTFLFGIADALQKAAGPVKERSMREQKYFPGWRPGSPEKEPPLSAAAIEKFLAPSVKVEKWFPETKKMTPEELKAWFAGQPK